MELPIWQTSLTQRIVIVISRLFFYIVNEVSILFHSRKIASQMTQPHSLEASEKQDEIVTTLKVLSWQQLLKDNNQT